MQNPVLIEIEQLQATQRVKYWYTYSVSATVQNGQSEPLFLNIEQDADFHIHEITVSAAGPVNEDGTPIGTGATAGETAVTDFPLYGNTEQAVRGLTMRVTDSGSGRELTSGEVPIENLGTPGYGQQMYVPFKLKYLALRNTKLRFDVRNRDLATTTPGNETQYHQITIALHGYKYESYLGV